MFNLNKLFLSQNQVDFFYKSAGVSKHNNNNRCQNKNTRKNHYNNNDYKLKKYSNRTNYNNQKNYNNQNNIINKFNNRYNNQKKYNNQNNIINKFNNKYNSQNIYNNQKNYNNQNNNNTINKNKNKYVFKNNQQINVASKSIKINNRFINKRVAITNQKKKVFFFKDLKIKHLTFKNFYLNKLAYLSNLSLCINNKINRRKFFLLKKNVKLSLLAKASITVVPRKFYYNITARPLFIYKKKPLFFNGRSQIYKNISKNLYSDKFRPNFLFNVKNKKKHISFFNKNRIFVSFWHNQLKNNSKNNLKLFFPKRDSLRHFRVFFKNTRALLHRRTKFIKAMVPNI